MISQLSRWLPMIVATAAMTVSRLRHMNVHTEGAHVDEWRETVIAAIEATRPGREVFGR